MPKMTPAETLQKAEETLVNVNKMLGQLKAKLPLAETASAIAQQGGDEAQVNIKKKALEAIQSDITRYTLAATKLVELIQATKNEIAESQMAIEVNGSPRKSPKSLMSTVKEAAADTAATVKKLIRSKSAPAVDKVVAPDEEALLAKEKRNSLPTDYKIAIGGPGH